MSHQTKVNRIGSGTQEKVNQRRLHKGAWMTSQLRQFFQASQAVHGADDIKSQKF